MKEFIKKNFALLLAFILPILLIVVVALSTYLPSLFLSTNYNFLYTSCTQGANYYPYRCNDYLQERYSVVDNKIVVNSVEQTKGSDRDNVQAVDVVDGNFTARIFLHDTNKNESREITQEEAQTLELNSLLTSPDGITVSSSYARGADFFLIFDGGSSYGYYLTKGSSKDKLNLINSNQRYYYRDNFQFIGWVLPGRDKQ